MPYIGQQPAPKVVTSSDLADDVVTADKIGDTAISGFSALGATPADTDEFLVSDAGTLKRMDYSYIKGGATHTLLSTNTVSSGVSDVTISSNIDSTYKNYMFDIINLHPATDNTTFRMQFVQSGSVTTSSIYDYAFHRVQSDNSDSYDYTFDDPQISMLVNLGNANDEAVSGRVFLHEPSNTTFNTHSAYYFTYCNNADKLVHTNGGGRIESATAVTGVKFFMSSGNIDSAIIKLYGIT